MSFLVTDDWKVGYSPFSNNYYFYIEDTVANDGSIKKILDITHNPEIVERILCCINYCKSISTEELKEKTGTKSIPKNKAKALYNSKI